MATFNFDEIRLTVGEDGEMVLAPMTNEDWNEYYNDLAREKAKPVGERSVEDVDVRLFDRKLLRVKTLTARLKGGKVVPVTMKNLDRIPRESKLTAVFLAYKEGSNIDIKKSSGTSVASGSAQKSRRAKS